MHTFLFLFLCVPLCFTYPLDNYEDGYFLAKITTIDEHDARRIGRKHGFEVQRKLQSYDDVYIGKREIRRRRKRGIEDEIVEEMMLSQQVKFIEKLNNFRRYTRAAIEFKNKPVHVWKLEPSMKIEEAWKSGYNGANVTIAIIDDGVDVEHVDLRNQFSPHVSFDFVRFGTLPIPKNRKDFQHGTQCAGLVSMEGNQCGLGVGHGAVLGGIRLLSNDMLNDALEGDALAFQRNKIDIYSVSWGPKDDGITAEMPQSFTSSAIRQGVLEGRNGKGNIYVWASGNGGMNGDNCALDGYVSNENTISFGVIGSDGQPAKYAEGCSAVLAAVSGGDSMIQTTGLGSTCSAISGSSASAAIAAGIIGLTLQANPSLTQRDIQHLIIKSSNIESIKNLKLTENAAGFKFHPKVGFGLLDAEKLVNMAKEWKNVGEQLVCEVSKVPTSIVDFTSCSQISAIEKVIIDATIHHVHRGMVRFEVESPQGTRSEVLPLRKNDKTADLIKWAFVSTHYYGERPMGMWKLHIISEEDIKFHVDIHNIKITGI